MIYIAALLPLVGLALLTFGIKGKRIDDHPLCRKCGFDLFNKPDTSTRCPECGNDLSRRRSTRIGHRKKRYLVATLGMLIVSASVLGIGVLIWANYHTRDLDTLKPVWLLSFETRQPTGNTKLWTELVRRVTAGQLSSAQAKPLVERILRWQGNAKINWDPIWGDFVETAFSAVLLTDKDWQTYIRQGPQVTLRVRSQVRRCDKLPISIDIRPARFSRNGQWFLQLTQPILSGEFLSTDASSSLKIPVGIPFRASQEFSTCALLPLNQIVRFTPEGPHEITIRSSLAVSQSFSFPLKAPNAKLDILLKAQWNLVAANAQTVELFPNTKPEYRHRIEQSFMASLGRPPGHDEHWMSYVTYIHHPSAPVSWRIFAKNADREWELRTICCSPDSDALASGEINLGNASPDKVDLVFRPDVTPAYNTVDLTSIWNGEITLKGFVVNTRPTTTHPTTDK